MAYKDPEKAKAYHRKWSKANAKKLSAKKREFRKANPYWYRDNYLRREYGITAQDYDSLLAEQDGRCALFETCGATVPGGGTKHWHVDHDHSTNAVRGLLCHACNAHRVGSNDLQSALAVVRYLQRNATTQGATP